MLPVVFIAETKKPGGAAGDTMTITLRSVRTRPIMFAAVQNSSSGGSIPVGGVGTAVRMTGGTTAIGASDCGDGTTACVVQVLAPGSVEGLAMSLESSQRRAVARTVSTHAQPAKCSAWTLPAGDKSRYHQPERDMPQSNLADVGNTISCRLAVDEINQIPAAAQRHHADAVPSRRKRGVRCPPEGPTTGYGSQCRD